MRDAAPAIRELRSQRRGRARRDCSPRRGASWPPARHPPDTVLEQLAATLTNRLLHAPSAALREAAEGGDDALAAAAARLFRTGREAP